MIYELKEKEMAKAAFLFDGWQETLIWSCLQGVMGSLYADSSERPCAAAVLLGDFYFLAGEEDEELLLHEAVRKDFLIMVPQNGAWENLIEQCLAEKAKKVVRYAIKKEPDIFEREKLQAFVDGLSGGYVLKMIDEPLFWRCRQEEWCRDWTAQYKDYAYYEKYGLGAVILKDGEPISGASSYSGYVGGIEVEIDTRADHRRKGLATVCGAKLILECLKRDLYPSWDAQNRWSAALAEKLGYHYGHAYTAYEITR